MNNIVELKQAPVIEYDKLVEVGNKVDERLSVYNFDNLLVDENSVKGYKKLRADLNKELKQFEDTRKLIKSEINKPYDEFNDTYNDHIKTKYKNAVNKLKEAIDHSDNKRKQEIEVKAREYFEEHNNHDFITFERLELKILLSTTVKSLQDEIDTFLNNVDNDIKLIELQEYKERVLVKYQNNLNVSQAIFEVQEEVSREQALKEVKEEPKVEPVAEQVEEVETHMLFVTCTNKQLNELKIYMNEKVIKFE